MKANFATFANALCHLNATPLSVAVLAPCAWGKNLACGGTWQSVAKWAVFAGEVGKVKMGQCLGGGPLSLVACAFGTLKFLNALFMRFCVLFVILSLCKKAKNLHTYHFWTLR